MTRKNYISAFILLLLTGAGIAGGCNKNDNKMPDNISPSESGYMAAEKDMKLTYTITEGDGLGTGYTWHVTNVKDSSGYKVASSELLFDGSIVIHTQGRYNNEKTISLGDNMPAIYFQLLDKMKKTFNTSFTHEERPITTVIPHKDQLNAIVSGELTVGEWHGIGTDGDTKTQQDYVVKQSEGVIDALDHIKIGLGEFDCLRIRYTNNAHSKMVITDKYAGAQTFENDFKSEVTVWVALGLGIIKTTEASSAGISTTELTKIEKQLILP